MQRRPVTQRKASKDYGRAVAYSPRALITALVERYGSIFFCGIKLSCHVQTPAAQEIYVWQLSQFRLGCLPAAGWFIVCQYMARLEYPELSVDSVQPLRILVSHRIRGIIRHRRESPSGQTSRAHYRRQPEAVVITRRRVGGADARKAESESALWKWRSDWGIIKLPFR